MQKNDDIIFRVDEASDLPIWVQLRNRIAYLIRTGRFKAGEQLPSVRSLAADAKINYNTVTKAYRDLELSELIVSVRGRGMFVRSDVAVSDEREEAADALLENCIGQYRACGMSYADIRARVGAMIDGLEEQARKAEREGQGYGIVG